MIPVTDSDHKLLPLHFSFDPGPDFVWTSFVNESVVESCGGIQATSYNTCLSGERKEGENLDLLKSYLELVKVPLPEWLIDHSSVAASTGSSSMLPPSPPPPLVPLPTSVCKENPPSNVLANKMVHQKPPNHQENNCYPNQIVSVAYSEPNYVVDVNYLEQHDRRNRTNQVNIE